MTVKSPAPTPVGLPRRRAVVAGVVAVSVALGLSGCYQRSAESPPVELPLTSSATISAAPAAPLPTAEALTDVLNRLADPAVPGADKVDLIQGAKPDAAATIDRFATALKDGGYLPLTFDLTDIGWSDRHPGNATADVSVSTASPDTKSFSFPMEFTQHAGEWQLSQHTADMLLAFGNAQTAATAGANPTRQPTG